MRLRDEPFFKPLCIAVMVLCLLLSLWMVAVVVGRLREADRSAWEDARQQHTQEEAAIAELGASNDQNWEEIVWHNQQIAQEKQLLADLTNHLKGYSAERMRLEIYEQELADVLAYGEALRTATLPVLPLRYDTDDQFESEQAREATLGASTFLYPALSTAFALESAPGSEYMQVLEQVNRYADETLSPLIKQVQKGVAEMDGRMRTISEYLARCRTGDDIFLRLDLLDRLAGGGLEEYLYGGQVETLIDALWELRYRYEAVCKLYELVLSDSQANREYCAQWGAAVSQLDALLEEYDPYRAQITQSQIDSWRVEAITLYRQAADSLANIEPSLGGLRPMARESLQLGETEYRLYAAGRGEVILTLWEEDLSSGEVIAWHYYDNQGKLLLTMRADGRKAYAFSGEECSAPDAPSGTLQTEELVENSLWLRDQLSAGQAPDEQEYRSRFVS